MEREVKEIKLHGVWLTDKPSDKNCVINCILPPDAVEVTEDCDIYFKDGRHISCQYKPTYTFDECIGGPKYGTDICPKWLFEEKEKGEKDVQ